jgi:hypothetical protein
VHIAIEKHDIAASVRCERGLSPALKSGEVTLVQRRRGRQCLQSADLADDVAIDLRRQCTRLIAQLVSDLVELRVTDAKSCVHAEQQERCNDCASEYDQEMSRRPGLAERRHRSDPDNDPAGNAEQANGGRQRGRPA